MPSELPWLYVENLIKDNWTLPQVTENEIDWGYFPEATGQNLNQYTLKCEDASQLAVDHYGIPLSHSLIQNGVGILIGCRDVSDEKTKPPANYRLIIEHVRTILKANKFPAGDFHEIRLTQGSREIENKMTNNTRWFVYYMTLSIWYWD